MGIGASIFLIAIGAILSFALTRNFIPFVDQTVVGYILIGAGVLGLIVSLIFMSSVGRRRAAHTVVEHEPAEPVVRRDVGEL